MSWEAAGAAGVNETGTGNGGGDPEASNNYLFGPRDTAARLDITWAVDSEGEIRGMWRRQLRLENYWLMGGHMQFRRWHSRALAVQIEAALEGVVPPAYRDTLAPRTI